MKFKVLALTFGKPADIYYLVGLNSHMLERREVRHAGNDQFTGTLESDEASVEQMVNVGR